MNTILCKGGSNRDRWAISLCFASATLMSLEASRPSACAWMGLNADQSFALSATFATLSVFLATFLLSRLIGARAVEK